MIILDATTKSVTVNSDAAATTTELSYVSSYVDITTTAFTPAANDGLTSSTAKQTIVAAPASSTQRQVKFMSVNNQDTVAHTVTFNYDNNGTFRQLIACTLLVGDTLCYTDKRGFYVIDSSGAEKPAISVIPYSAFLNSSFNAANLTTALTTTSNESYAVWLGTANKVTSSVSVTMRVTQAIATITWGEVAIFSGNVNLGGNPTLTRLGFADVSGTFNSTGVITTNVALTTPTTIGQDLWCVFGAQATTVLAVRAGLADDIQSGIYANKTSTRPSTVTSPTGWTLGNATDAIPWIRAYLN